MGIRIATIFLCTLALVSGACVNNAFTPPTHGFLLEGSRTTSPGATRARVDGGEHSEIFGPSAKAGSLRVRRGVSPGLEVAVSGSVLKITDKADVCTDRRIWTGRVGAKRELGSPHIAAVGGVGVGSNRSAGEFISADGGLIIAYENCHVTPMVGAIAFVSDPIAPRRVLLEGGDDPVTDTPETTYGATYTAGLRIGGGQGCEGKSRMAAESIYLGLGATHLVDDDESLVMMGFSAGLELLF